MKILVIAPHPDDEILGPGGTLIRHVLAGDKVYHAIVTQAHTPEWSEEFIEQRKQEIENANRLVGVTKTFLLGFPTAKLNTIPQNEFNLKFINLVKEVRPDVMYIPHQGDLNMDHRLTFEACLVGARPKDHIVGEILAYETLSETEWGNSIRPFVPNVYVDISNVVEKKLIALSAYKSEVYTYPHPRSLDAIKTLARKRGAEIGCEYAESFMQIRKIIKQV